MKTSRRRPPVIAWAIAAATLYAMGFGPCSVAPAAADDSAAGVTSGKDSKDGKDDGPRRHGRDHSRSPADGGDWSPGEPCHWWPIPPGPPPVPVVPVDSRGDNGLTAIPATVPMAPVPALDDGVDTTVDIAELSTDAAPATTAAAVVPPTAVGSPSLVWSPLGAAGAPRAPAPAPAAPILPVRTVPAPVAPPPPMSRPAAKPSPPQRPGVIAEPAAPVRLGYPDGLRDADLAKVVALALPGLAAMAAMTAFGGVVGYRQAKFGYRLRAAAAGRFLQ